MYTCTVEPSLLHSLFTVALLIHPVSGCLLSVFCKPLYFNHVNYSLFTVGLSNDCFTYTWPVSGSHLSIYCKPVYCNHVFVVYSLMIALLIQYLYLVASSVWCLFTVIFSTIILYLLITDRPSGDCYTYTCTIPVRGCLLSDACLL